MTKPLLPFLLVIVYMNSGHILRYKNAQSVCNNQSDGDFLFDDGHAATLLYVSTDQPRHCIPQRDIIATLPLASIERWEVK